MGSNPTAAIETFCSKLQQKVIIELLRYTNSFTFLGAANTSKTLFYFATFRALVRVDSLYKKNRHESSSEKDYTLLGIECLFFLEKGFKKTFRLLFNSILRFRLPEWKVSLFKQLLIYGIQLRKRTGL